VECLLTLKRLHEGERRGEGEPAPEAARMAKLSPVRTDNMKPFVSAPPARSSSPLRRTPPPPPLQPSVEYSTSSATPDINFEAVTSQYFQGGAGGTPLPPHTPPPPPHTHTFLPTIIAAPDKIYARLRRLVSAMAMLLDCSRLHNILST